MRHLSKMQWFNLWMATCNSTHPCYQGWKARGKDKRVPVEVSSGNNPLPSFSRVVKPDAFC